MLKQPGLFPSVNQIPPAGLTTQKEQAIDLLEGLRRKEEGGEEQEFIKMEAKTMKFFKAKTISGTSSYLDWYNAESADDAKILWEADKEKNGLPEDSSVELVECDPETFRPIE